MPDAVVLDCVFTPDVPALAKRLRLEKRPELADRLAALAAEAQTVARPRAMYREAYVDSRGDEHVIVEGVRLTSRVLRVNLEDAYRVFPFVVTCGREMEEWAAARADSLDRFLADALMEAAVRQPFLAVGEHIRTHHLPGHTGVMNPGSLEDWPLDQQTELFTLVGDVHTAIGVRLTDSFLMVPLKSVSGLRFPTESNYENCQLCPRDPCPGRRAPYDPQLYAARYAGPVVA